MTTIDRNDTDRAIMRHLPDGETYIVEYASVWDDDDRCTGSTIIAAAGPIHYADLWANDGPTDPLPDAVRERVRNWDLTADENVDWLNEEEAAGRLSNPYPGPV